MGRPALSPHAAAVLREYRDAIHLAAEATKGGRVKELKLLAQWALDASNAADHATLRCPPGTASGAGAAALSWDELVHAVTHYVRERASRAGSPAHVVEGVACLATLVDVADAPAIAAGADAQAGDLQLRGAVRPLFRTLAAVLRVDALRAAVAGAVLTLLTKRLLPRREYTARAGGAVLREYAALLLQLGLAVGGGGDPAASAAASTAAKDKGARGTKAARPPPPHAYLATLTLYVDSCPADVAFEQGDPGGGAACEPAVPLQLVWRYLRRWLAGTGRDVAHLVAALQGGDGKAAARRGAGTGDGGDAAMDVDDEGDDDADGGADAEAAAAAAVRALDGPRGDAEVWTALLALLTAVMAKRGATAHPALRAPSGGAQVVAFTALGRVWGVLAADKRTLAVAAPFLVAAARCTTEAYAAERGEEGAPLPLPPAAAVASADPLLRWAAPWPLGGAVASACTPGTATAVPLGLRTAHAVPGASLPAALLGSFAAHPRLNRYTEPDVLVPALLGLGSHVLPASAVYDWGLRSYSGVSSTAMGGGSVVDLDAAPSTGGGWPNDYLRLAADVVYYRHARATAAALRAGGQRPAARNRDLSEYGYADAFAGDGSAGASAGSASSQVLEWPTLLDAVCGRYLAATSQKVGGGDAAAAVAGGAPAVGPAGASRGVPLVALELTAATLSRHPELLPRGAPTAVLIRSLTAELQNCRRMDGNRLASCLRLLLLLMEVATVGAADKAAAPFALTVAVSDADAAGALAKFAAPAADAALATGAMHPQQVGRFARVAVLSCHAPLGHADLRTVAGVSPFIEASADANAALSRHVDARHVAAELSRAKAAAAAEEGAAWEACMAALARSVLPLVAARAEAARVAQHALRLLARIVRLSALAERQLQLVEGPSPAAPPPPPPAAYDEDHLFVPASRLLLTSSACMPLPAVGHLAGRPGVLEGLLALPVFHDVRSYSGTGAADTRELVATSSTSVTRGDGSGGSGAGDAAGGGSQQPSASVPGTAEHELVGAMVDAGLLADAAGGAPPSSGGSTAAVAASPAAGLAERLSSVDGFEEAVTQAAVAYRLLFPGATAADADAAVARLLSTRRAAPVLLWLLLRLRTEAADNQLRPQRLRVDVADAALSTVASSLHRLLAALTPSETKPPLSSSSSTSTCAPAAPIAAAAPSFTPAPAVPGATLSLSSSTSASTSQPPMPHEALGCLAAATDASWPSTLLASCAFAQPSQPPVLTAATLVGDSFTAVYAPAASTSTAGSVPASGAALALVAATLLEAASQATGVPLWQAATSVQPPSADGTVPVELDDAEDLESGGDGAAAAATSSATTASGGVEARRESEVCRAVARYSNCAGPLQLQAALQLATLTSACIGASSTSATDPAVAPGLALLRTVLSALLTYVAVHYPAGMAACLVGKLTPLAAGGNDVTSPSAAGGKGGPDTEQAAACVVSRARTIARTARLLVAPSPQPSSLYARPPPAAFSRTAAAALSVIYITSLALAQDVADVPTAIVLTLDASAAAASFRQAVLGKGMLAQADEVFKPAVAANAAGGELAASAASYGGAGAGAGSKRGRATFDDDGEDDEDGGSYGGRRRAAKRSAAAAAAAADDDVNDDGLGGGGADDEDDALLEEAEFGVSTQSRGLRSVSQARGVLPSVARGGRKPAARPAAAAVSSSSAAGGDSDDTDEFGDDSDDGGGGHGRGGGADDDVGDSILQSTATSAASAGAARATDLLLCELVDTVALLDGLADAAVSLPLRCSKIEPEGLLHAQFLRPVVGRVLGATTRASGASSPHTATAGTGSGPRVVDALRFICHFGAGAGVAGGVAAGVASAALALAQHIAYRAVVPLLTRRGGPLEPGARSNLTAELGAQAAEDARSAAHALASSLVPGDAPQSTDLATKCSSPVYGSVIMAVAALAARHAAHVIDGQMHSAPPVLGAIRALLLASRGPAAYATVTDGVQQGLARAVAAALSVQAPPAPESLFACLADAGSPLPLSGAAAGAGAGAGASSSSSTSSGAAAGLAHAAVMAVPYLLATLLPPNVVECLSVPARDVLVPPHVYAEQPFVRQPALLGARMPEHAIPFLAATSVSGDPGAPLGSMDGVVSLAALVLGVALYVNPYTGDAVGAPPAARSAQLALLSDALRLIAADYFDAGVTALVTNYSRVDGNARYPALPNAPLLPNADLLQSLMLSRGCNTLDGGTRAVAARSLPAYVGAFAPPELYRQRAWVATCDNGRGAAAAVEFLMLPLPPVAPADVRRLAGSYAPPPKGGSHDLPAGAHSRDSYFATDGAGEDRHRSALWALACVVSAGHHDAVPALVELLARCGAHHPSHALARTAVAAAAAALSFPDAVGLLRHLAEPVLELWATRRYPLAALPVALFGHASLQAFATAYRPLLVPLALLGAAKRRAYYVLQGTSPAAAKERGALRALYGDARTVLTAAVNTAGAPVPAIEAVAPPPALAPEETFAVDDGAHWDAEVAAAMLGSYDTPASAWAVSLADVRRGGASELYALLLAVSTPPPPAPSFAAAAAAAAAATGGDGASSALGAMAISVGRTLVADRRAGEDVPAVVLLGDEPADPFVVAADADASGAPLQPLSGDDLRDVGDLLLEAFLPETWAAVVALALTDAKAPPPEEGGHEAHRLPLRRVLFAAALATLRDLLPFDGPPPQVVAGQPPPVGIGLPSGASKLAGWMRDVATSYVQPRLSSAVQATFRMEASAPTRGFGAAGVLWQVQPAPARAALAVAMRCTGHKALRSLTPGLLLVLVTPQETLALAAMQVGAAVARYKAALAAADTAAASADGCLAAVASAGAAAVSLLEALPALLAVKDGAGQSLPFGTLSVLLSSWLHCATAVASSISEAVVAAAGAPATDAGGVAASEAGAVFAPLGSAVTQLVVNLTDLANQLLPASAPTLVQSLQAAFVELLRGLRAYAASVLLGAHAIAAATPSTALLSVAGATDALVGPLAEACKQLLRALPSCSGKPAVVAAAAYALVRVASDVTSVARTCAAGPRALPPALSYLRRTLALLARDLQTGLVKQGLAARVPSAGGGASLAAAVTAVTDALQGARLPDGAVGGDVTPALPSAAAAPVVTSLLRLEAVLRAKAHGVQDSPEEAACGAYLVARGDAVPAHRPPVALCQHLLLRWLRDAALSPSPGASGATPIAFAPLATRVLGLLQYVSEHAHQQLSFPAEVGCSESLLHTPLELVALLHEPFSHVHDHTHGLLVEKAPRVWVTLTLEADKPSKADAAAAVQPPAPTVRSLKTVELRPEARAGRVAALAALASDAGAYAAHRAFEDAATLPACLWSSPDVAAALYGSGPVDSSGLSGESLRAVPDVPPSCQQHHAFMRALGLVAAALESGGAARLYSLPLGGSAAAAAVPSSADPASFWFTLAGGFAGSGYLRAAVAALSGMNAIKSLPGRYRDLFKPLQPLTAGTRPFGPALPVDGLDGEGVYNDSTSTATLPTHAPTQSLHLRLAAAAAAAGRGDADMREEGGDDVDDDADGSMGGGDADRRAAPFAYQDALSEPVWGLGRQLHLPSPAPPPTLSTPALRALPPAWPCAPVVALTAALVRGHVLRVLMPLFAASVPVAREMLPTVVTFALADAAFAAGNSVRSASGKGAGAGAGPGADGDAAASLLAAVGSDTSDTDGANGLAGERGITMLARYRLLQSQGHGVATAPSAGDGAGAGAGGKQATAASSPASPPASQLTVLQQLLEPRVLTKDDLRRAGLQRTLLVTGPQRRLSQLLSAAVGGNGGGGGAALQQPSAAALPPAVVVDCVLRTQNLLRLTRSHTLHLGSDIRADARVDDTKPVLAALRKSAAGGGPSATIASPLPAPGAPPPPDNTVVLMPPGEDAALGAIYSAYNSSLLLQGASSTSAKLALFLDVDYRALALAASAAGHDAHALVHGEMWWQNARAFAAAAAAAAGPAAGVDGGSSAAASESAGSAAATVTPSPTAVLARIYEDIDDPDALLGVTGESGLQAVLARQNQQQQGGGNAVELLLGSSDLDVLRRLAVHQRGWEAALTIADAQATASAATSGSPATALSSMLQPATALGLSRVASLLQSRPQQAGAVAVNGSGGSVAERQQQLLLLGRRFQSSLCEGLLGEQTRAAAAVPGGRALAFSLLHTGALPVLPPVLPGAPHELHASHVRWMVAHQDGAHDAVSRWDYNGHGADRAHVRSALLAVGSGSPAPPGTAAARSLRRAFLVSQLLSQAKQARHDGRYARCATSLFELSAVVGGGGVSAPSASPVTDGAAFSADTSAERAAVLAEQAKLAWAQGDVDAALALVSHAASLYISVVAALLQQQPQSGAAVADPHTGWLRATVAGTHLSDVLTLAGTWLSSSGLDASSSASEGGLVQGTRANLEGLDVALTAANPFVPREPPAAPLLQAPPGGKGAKAAKPAVPPAPPAASPVASALAVLSSIAAQLLHLPLAQVTALGLPPPAAALGGAAALMRSATVLSQAASAPAISPTVAVAAYSGGGLLFTGASTTVGGVASRSARAYFQAAEALAIALPHAPQAAAAAAPAATLASASSSTSTHVRRCLQSRAYLALADYADRAGAALRAQRSSPDYVGVQAQRRERRERLRSMHALRREADERLRAKDTKGASTLLGGLSRSDFVLYLGELEQAVKEDEHAVARTAAALVAHASTAIRAYCAFLRTLPPGSNSSGSAAGALPPEAAPAVGDAGTAQLRVAFRLVSLLYDASSPLLQGGGSGAAGDDAGGLRGSSSGSSSSGSGDGGVPNATLVSLVGRELAAVPATAFLDAMPQIVSRLGPDPGACDVEVAPAAKQGSGGAAEDAVVAGFRALVSRYRGVAEWGVPGITECLVTRMLLACPHRVLLPLLAMEKGARDVGHAGSVDTAKVAAARRLLARASTASPRLRAIVESTRLLTDAYVSIAAVPTDRVSKGARRPLAGIRLDRLGDGSRGGQQPAQQGGAGAGSSASGSPAAAAATAAGHGEPLAWLFASASPAMGDLLRHMPVVTAYHTDVLPPALQEDYYALAQQQQPGSISLAAAALGDAGGAVAAGAGAVDWAPAGYALPVHLASLGDTYTVAASGLAMPKFIDVTGSDGRPYAQLVKRVGKGNSLEDMRQDAVMEQLFSVVNRFLTRDAAARARRLRIRTYKVVPTTVNSGVLERVTGTVALGTYLAGAHARYHPDEMSPGEARAAMNAASKAVKDMMAAAAAAAAADAKKGGGASGAAAASGLPPLASDPRLTTLAALYGRITPVMRHFFADVFPQPAAWAAARACYARSTATNSIVGYVAGIGDRHVQNILLDGHTGEAVHIDFGIAFEQARLLPTPEQVFFRLTRDVVDGLGPTGTRGTFAACCEATLRVLRAQEGVVVTVLGVVLGDPLYRWRIGPDKARRVQRAREEGGGGGGGDVASRGRSESVTRGAAAGPSDSVAGSARAAAGATGGGGRTGAGGRDRDLSVARVFAPPGGAGAGAGGAAVTPGGSGRTGDDGAGNDDGDVDEGGAGGPGGSPAGDADAEAARAIQRARLKLLGQEFSETTGVSLSVPSHVQRVLEDHQSLLKLALMFEGWQAYL